MDEFKFVLKCFAFAALFMVLTQIKTAEDVTLEQKIEASLVNSTVSEFVNKVAAGGVKLIKDGAHSAKEAYYNWKHSDIDKNKKTEATVDNIKEEKIAKLKTAPVEESSKMKFQEAQAKIEELSAEEAELIEE